jgi:hypothetical protein
MSSTSHGRYGSAGLHTTWGPLGTNLNDGGQVADDPVPVGVGYAAAAEAVASASVRPPVKVKLIT